MTQLRIGKKTVGSVTYYRAEALRKYFFFFKKWVPFKCYYYTGGEIDYDCSEWTLRVESAQKQLDYYELLRK